MAKAEPRFPNPGDMLRALDRNRFPVVTPDDGRNILIDAGCLLSGEGYLAHENGELQLIRVQVTAKTYRFFVLAHGLLVLHAKVSPKTIKIESYLNDDRWISQLREWRKHVQDNTSEGSAPVA